MTKTELKEARKVASLTRKALGRLVWVSERTVESWETGARKIPEPMVHLLNYRLYGTPIPEGDDNERK